MIPFEPIQSFYLQHLPDAEMKGQRILAPCPFCQRADQPDTGKIVVMVNPESYFRGYFRCTRQCVPGGFHFYFARLMGIGDAGVPGAEDQAEPYAFDVHFPPRHLAAEIDRFESLMGEDQNAYFNRFGVTPNALKELRVGFNGRYFVYPYFLDSGFAYAGRCVMPDREDDHFWHGNEDFAREEFRTYNLPEIERCRGGALFLTEGEINLLILKSLGYPAISVPSSADLSHIAPERLAQIEHLFLLVANTPEARQSARNLATQLGFKARIVPWPDAFGKGGQLLNLAEEDPQGLKKNVAAMIGASRAFSPFAPPGREHQHLVEFIEKDKGKSLLGIETGFAKLDAAMDGLRGINIMGGPPKAGKSCFFMQISTQIARRKVPVIYYDFENGRQKIYMRTLVRTSRLPEKKIRSTELDAQGSSQLKTAMNQFHDMLTYFRVVSDRQLTPEVMRRHIDFLKHETRKDDLLIVLDSLHKLPFKSLTERRTGIDFWLRQIEAIRDEHHVSFLVISELARGKGGGYGEKPDMGSFKESGDIEYSADNALILMPDWDPLDPGSTRERKNHLWMVASRENNPGQVAQYQLDYPYWCFREI